MNNEKNAPVLTLEHLSPYLPYGLEFTNMGLDCFGNIETRLLTPTSVEPLLHPQNDKKPILRPLSDLTKEIEHNGESFVPMVRICEFLKIKFKNFQLLDKSVDLVLNDKKSRQVRLWFSNFQGIFFNCSDMGVLRYRDHFGAIKKIIEWHFDVFGLIEKGLAIDYNTVKEGPNEI